MHKHRSHTNIAYSQMLHVDQKTSGTYESMMYCIFCSQWTHAATTSCMNGWWTTWNSF